MSTRTILVRLVEAMQNKGMPNANLLIDFSIIFGLS